MMLNSLYYLFFIFNIFFYIHILIHISLTDKLSIDETPVTYHTKNFF